MKNIITIIGLDRECIMLIRTKKSIDVEHFWKIWIRLIDLTNNGSAVIVEGYRDKIALEKLHITRNVVILQKYGLSKTVDYLRTRYNQAVILTDFDKEGEYLAKNLFNILTVEGIHVDQSIRNELRKILSKIRQIENLNTIADHLNEKAPFYIYNGSSFTQI